MGEFTNFVNKLILGLTIFILGYKIKISRESGKPQRKGKVTIGSKEHYEILDSFEKQFSEYRLDKEARGLWIKGIVYQSGETNALYTAFISGYSSGRCAYLNQ